MGAFSFNDYKIISCGEGGGLVTNDPAWYARALLFADMNPFNHPKNQGLRTTYTRDMCPRTTDILSRTVFINLHPDMTDAQVDASIAACARAAAQP